MILKAQYYFKHRLQIGASRAGTAPITNRRQQGGNSTDYKSAPAGREQHRLQIDTKGFLCGTCVPSVKLCVTILDSLQKRRRDFEYQVLIESVDPYHDAVTCADFNEFTCKSEK